LQYSLSIERIAMRFRFSTLMLLLLSACNMQAQQLPTPDGEGNIFVTVTPALPTPNEEGVIVITATPLTSDVSAASASLPTSQQPATVALSTVEPSPIIPPTSIVDPRQLLNEADQLLRDGYFEEAVAAYQAILEQITEPDLRGEAAFKLGQTALKEGLFTTAVDALSLLITELPTDPNISQAYFLRGDAYLGLSQWQAAVNDFQQYLSLRPNLIDSYVYERIGDAQLALEQSDAALLSYTSALAANRSAVPLLILREKLAQIFLSLGRTDEAVDQYDAILATAQNAGYRAEINTLAAEALVLGGQNELAVLRAQNVFESSPETTAAYRAMQILDDNGVETDSYTRGIVYFTYGSYPEAINAFNEFTSTHQIAAIPANLYLLLGRAYRELGNWEGARVSFQTLIDQYSNDPLLGTALLERGRTYFLEGNIEQAIQTYTTIADDYPAITEAAEALWRAAYLYATQLDDFENSRNVFTRLANDYPNSSWALSGLQLAASSAISQNQPLVAENFYGRIAMIATGEDRAAALYWVGRLARQRGDTRGSDDAFAQAISAAPESFYALRAADIVAGREAFQAPANLNFDFDEEAERLEAEAWLRTTFEISQTGDLHTLSPELANDPRMVRGRELWAVGAYEESKTEFTALLDESRANGNALNAYQLAHYFRDIGDYRSSIVAAADVIVASGATTLDAPAYIARMRYPAYYIGLILPQANNYGFDPLLMLALIRQESLYDTNATSVANALGLAQVIPSTAAYIAEELEWQNFEDADLFRPYVGIAFGAFYLDEQLRIFDGIPGIALAAYNAGPGYTLDWYRLSGGDIDAFVAAITFDETQRYVQRIYSHYTIYRELYGS
jgi:soluble lytic murein transglycosylase